MTQHASNSNKPNGASATEDLLNANVLPHLPQPEMKVSYLSHLVGLLLNYLFLPAARHSLQYDKDHMGIRNLFFCDGFRAANKRVDVCGPLLSHLRECENISFTLPRLQQIRNALFRMRSFVIHVDASAPTCQRTWACQGHDVSVPNGVSGT